MAFLDGDDIWHPKYLEFQHSILNRHPDAVVSFTGSINFSGNGRYEWMFDPMDQPTVERMILPIEFVKTYNKMPGHFTPSRACVPMRVLSKLDDAPFKWRMAEDNYFFNQIAILGPVVVSPSRLVAYRVLQGSHSCDRLAIAQAEIRVFESLTKRYEMVPDAALTRAFRLCFDDKLRFCAKVLLGVGRTGPAREQLRRAFSTRSLLSLLKSLRILLLSYLPPMLQPSWPPAYRKSESEQ